MREPDASIPGDEPLYRWLTAEDVNGKEVLPHVVDLEGMSVDRQRYAANPLPDHQSHHPERTGLAETCGDKLPTDLTINGIAYEFFAVDLPEEDNVAHAEVRPGRKSSDDSNGDRPQGFKPKSRATKDELRSRMAEAMTVVRAPSPPM